MTSYPTVLFGDSPRGQQPVDLVHNGSALSLVAEGVEQSQSDAVLQPGTGENFEGGGGGEGREPIMQQYMYSVCSISMLKLAKYVN